jgi:glutamate synthase domain-containing protein 3
VPHEHLLRGRGDPGSGAAGNVTGKPEHVERFFRFVARDLREIMAEAGFRTVDEMIGRVDMLEVQPAIDHWKAKGVDLSAVLLPAGDPETTVRRRVRPQEHDLESALDVEIIRHAESALTKRQPVRIALPIRNVHRTVGTRLSGEVAKRFGAQGLPDGTIDLRFTGSAGQSLGAFLAPGISIRVEGDANDYLAKGMSGGRIVVTPPPGSAFLPHRNIIAGNVVLYGATGGELYLHGVAGERFAVRNSGRRRSSRGGDHGCEYMTGPRRRPRPHRRQLRGRDERRIAHVYDETELFDTRCNLDMVDVEAYGPEDVKELRTMIENHHKYTRSARAKMILDDWESRLPLFVKVMPVDYRKVLERMQLEEYREAETLSATEEVYRG